MTPTDRKSTYIVFALLILVTLAIYGQVRGFEFLNFDDGVYVVENARVQGGLTFDNMLWALTALDVESWQPLVWLSLMLDYELYGLQAGGFHMTNLILHLLSTLLLFWAMKRMTGALWRAGFVAAFFAFHPVHVESVAWIAERKDALSGVFFMLTLCLYVMYAEKPTLKRYGLVFGSFLLGLMSKPMLVTLPVILILLDVWPLGRLSPVSGLPNNKAAEVCAASWPALIRRQVMEKLPLFALSLLVGLVVMNAQAAQHVFEGVALHAFPERLANAFVSYITYLVNILAPHRLGAFYPFNDHIPVLMVMGSIFVLILLCFAAIMAVKRYPFIFVGWFWFVIMLLPVIGLIPLAQHALADRYTYLSSIGISLILAWGAPLFFKKDALRKKILMPAAWGYLIVLAALAWVQCGYWQNNFTLFSHTLKVTQHNDLMHYNLGKSYLKQGQLREAKGHLSKSLEINPNREDGYLNLGLVYFYEGNFSEAMRCFADGLKRYPQSGSLHANLAVVLKEMGRIDEAMITYEKAIALNSLSGAPHYNYAGLLMELGRFGEAERQLRAALNISPRNSAARYDLAGILVRDGRLSEAILQLEEALRYNPDSAEVRQALSEVRKRRDQH